MTDVRCQVFNLLSSSVGQTGTAKKHSHSLTMEVIPWTFLRRCDK